jgi:uncharacterized protein (TIGR02594 family)
MKNLNKVFIAILFVAIFSYSADAKPRRSVKKPPAQITKVVDYKGGTDLISMASRFIGQTARQIGLPPTLWCADFIGLLTKGGTHSRAALSYKNYGKPAQTGCVNCIAVLTRKGGGHVGIVKGYDRGGNPILISGNHGNRVAISSYSKNRVVAYRYPPGIS